MQALANKIKRRLETVKNWFKKERENHVCFFFFNFSLKNFFPDNRGKKL